jgi:hypothetical protein
MIGDPHGRTTGRATLLVRAVDEILGTHNADFGTYALNTPPADTSSATAPDP